MPNEPSQEYLDRRREQIEDALAIGDNGAAIVVMNEMRNDGYGCYAQVLVEQIRASR
ncbi:MAG TPA: hypothetical protein VJT31_28080 [Rugosimonospora sp.]|nr:hypothetical protein [Rugosimonospora sp.]